MLFVTTHEGSAQSRSVTRDLKLAMLFVYSKVSVSPGLSAAEEVAVPLSWKELHNESPSQCIEPVDGRSNLNVSLRAVPS